MSEMIKILIGFIKYFQLKYKLIQFKNINISNYFFNKNIFIALLYISGAIFYILSLTHIEGVYMHCFSYYGNQCYYILAKLTFISGLITGLAIYIIFYKGFNRIHFFIIIFTYLILYLLDHHKDMIRHGFYNFILFLLTILIFMILLLFLQFLLFLIKKKTYLLFIVIIILFTYFYFKLKFYKLNHFICNYWSKGLNNTYIDNLSKDYPCIINIPKSHSCYLSELGPYFDFTSKYRPTCLDSKIMEKEKEYLLKDLEALNHSEISKRNHFGFPLTNIDEFNPDDFGNACFEGNMNFEESIYKKVILMDLYNENKSFYYPNITKPEIEVIFKGETGKISINIEKNETLIKEREIII